jgi:ubiquinol oxidase
MVHYFEKEAVVSYTEYLSLIESGKIDNPPAPQLAIEYYKLSKKATLKDMIKKVRADEKKHRDVNWKYSL